MENKKFIWITTQFEGFHKYIDAPEEVSFLRNMHRHIFHVKIYIEVFNDNRDIEFIMFKREIERIIKKNRFENFASCEMISNNLYKVINKKYPKRDIKIEISEDNENGSYIEYNYS